MYEVKAMPTLIVLPTLTAPGLKIGLAPNLPDREIRLNMSRD